MATGSRFDFSSRARDQVHPLVVVRIHQEDEEDTTGRDRASGGASEGLALPCEAIASKLWRLCNRTKILHTFRAMPKDFLDEMIARRTRKNPRFPELMAEAERRRALAQTLAARRSALGVSQTVVAARMGTAASVISKLESGGDVKLSTLQRYCTAIGEKFPPRLRPRKRAA